MHKLPVPDRADQGMGGGLLPVNEAPATSEVFQTHRRMPSEASRGEEILLQDQENHLLQDDQSVEADIDYDEKLSVWPVLAAGCTLWGLQLVWSTIFARGTAYLKSIGIPISLSALLWIAGPLCGLVVQPVIGAISDSYEPGPGRNRRKPFILMGAIATACCMLGLAWTPNIVTFFVHFLGQSSRGVVLTVLAFIWVYGLNISIQPLQGGIRTLMHEVVPKWAQSWIAALNGIIVAVGTICGYMLASTSFGHASPGVASEVLRFQALSVVVASLLLICSAITVVCTYRTMDARKGGSYDQSFMFSLSLKDAIRRNRVCLRSMPRSIQLTLQVQFFSWMGWFPTLYYQTAYLAHLYRISSTTSSSSSHHAEQAAFDSLPFAVASLLTSIALLAVPQWRGYASRHASEGQSHRSLIMLVDFWLAGHVLFSITMASTPFATNATQGIVVFALTGIPRALSTWVPFALVGREVTESRDAGTLTSLHNAAISAPQILAASACVVLFMVAKYIGGQEETVWAMLLASVAGMLAAWKTWQLRAVMSQ